MPSDWSRRGSRPLGPPRGSGRAGAQAPPFTMRSLRQYVSPRARHAVARPAAARAPAPWEKSRGRPREAREPHDRRRPASHALDDRPGHGRWSSRWIEGYRMAETSEVVQWSSITEACCGRHGLIMRIALSFVALNAEVMPSPCSAGRARFSIVRPILHLLTIFLAAMSHVDMTE